MKFNLSDNKFIGISLFYGFAFFVEYFMNAGLLYIIACAISFFVIGFLNKDKSKNKQPKPKKEKKT